MAESAGQPVAQLLSPGATVPPEEDTFSDACSSHLGGGGAEAAEEQVEAPAQLQGSEPAASEAPADGIQPRGASEPVQQQTGGLAAPSSAGATGQDLAQHSPAGLPHAEGQNLQQQQAAAGSAPAGAAQADGVPSDQGVRPSGSVETVQDAAPSVGPALAAEMHMGELQRPADAQPASTKQQESPQRKPPAAVGPQPASSPQHEHEPPGQVSASNPAGLQPGASGRRTSVAAGPSLEHLRTVYDEIASTMLGVQGSRRQPKGGDAEAAGRQQADGRMLSSQGSSSRGQATDAAAAEQPQQPVLEPVRAAPLRPEVLLTAAAAAPQAGGGPQQVAAAQPAEASEAADKAAAQLPGPGAPGTGVGQPQARAEAGRVSLLCMQHLSSCA